MRTDVHQHWWPAALREQLRRRTTPPRLVGDLLLLPGEPPYPVSAADHDLAARAGLAAGDGLDRVLLSLSSPLGIEMLPTDEADPLLAAWHDGLAELPEPFAGWAAAGLRDLDPAGLRAVLDAGGIGLQLPATELGTPADLDRLGPLLSVLEEADRPLLVHPGPAGAGPAAVPAWWPALVPYVGQLHAAWFAWHQAGRAAHPRLRICFVALAGLAPLHHERLAARGGRFGPVDDRVFYDVSSYGQRAVEAVVRVVGMDGLVAGSDRPYATPSDLGGGAALDHAVHVVNPARLLGPSAKGTR